MLMELRDLGQDRGLADPRRPLPRLRRQRAALSPVLGGARPARHRAARRRRPGRLRPPRPGSAPARAPGASGRRLRRRGVVPPLARPRRPVRRRPRRPRGGSREGSRAAGHRGRPLGRPVDPRHARLPLPAPVRGPGLDRRLLPLRRPAPSPPAAQAGGRVGPAAGGRPAPAQPAVGVVGARAGGGARLRAHRRDRADATSSVGPTATRSSSRSWSPPAPVAGCPTTWPTCCWSASTGSTTTPARWCGSRASPVAR